jgi:hypothetical protein
MDYSLKGILRYDPSTISRKEPWWLILEVSPSIVEYYKYWIWKEKRIKVMKSLWGPHVSIVRGEEPPDERKDQWGKYEGEQRDVLYSVSLEKNDFYWWLLVKSDELVSIRRELGLRDEPSYGFHLTVGRVAPESKYK